MAQGNVARIEFRHAHGDELALALGVIGLVEHELGPNRGGRPNHDDGAGRVELLEDLRAEGCPAHEVHVPPDRVAPRPQLAGERLGQGSLLRFI